MAEIEAANTTESEAEDCILRSWEEMNRRSRSRPDNVLLSGLPDEDIGKFRTESTAAQSHDTNQRKIGHKQKGSYGRLTSAEKQNENRLANVLFGLNQELKELRDDESPKEPTKHDALFENEGNHHYVRRMFAVKRATSPETSPHVKGRSLLHSYRRL